MIARLDHLMGFLLLNVLVFANVAVCQPADSSLAPVRFAVVELFTSEGCSSCPPADRVLSKLATAEHKGLIIPLSYHVDYWDYLGWKDPFGSPENARRQRWYADKFASSRIYTPQMVVNGRREFVGSRETQAIAEVEKALQKAPVTLLTVSATATSTERANITCLIDGQLPETAAGYVLLVQKKAEKSVSRGENRGKKLSHSNIVRAIRQFDISTDQSAELSLDRIADLTPDQVFIVVFVQDLKSGAISCANMVDWPK